jgi:hypothetical protein
LSGTSDNLPRKQVIKSRQSPTIVKNIAPVEALVGPGWIEAVSSSDRGRSHKQSSSDQAGVTMFFQAEIDKASQRLTG